MSIRNVSSQGWVWPKGCTQPNGAGLPALYHGVQPRWGQCNQIHLGPILNHPPAATPHPTNPPFLPYPDNTDQISSSPSSADANLPPSHTQTPLWKSIFSSLSCSGQLCLNLDSLHMFSTVGNKEEITCFCYLAPSCLT